MYRYVQDYQNLICLTNLAKGWTVGEKLVQTQEDGFSGSLEGWFVGELLSVWTGKFVESTWKVSIHFC